MTPSELEAVLTTAFNQCESAACPLNEEQKGILRRSLQSWMAIPESTENPLNQLTADERQTLLAFVREQEAEQQPWKITLLNDWLQGRDSGPVQFIRERYGIQWVNQIQPSHLADHEDVMRLKVGDRIEVTNGLWEWVQDDGPCSREWFPCVVVSLREQEGQGTSCTIRFQNGAEYEVQGIYDWNRPNWRWLT